jgi:hypothetical protein
MLLVENRISNTFCPQGIMFQEEGHDEPKYIRRFELMISCNVFLSTGGGTKGK